MAQATADQCREFWSVPQSPPNEARTILQATTIYQMSLAMLVAGKARPYVSGTAGSTMLGFSRNSYAAPASADLVLGEDAPALFQRGVFACAGKAGDLPTEALIGKAVAFDDSSGTVKATPAANDLTGTLRAIKNGYFWVEI
jgi:hypothetical protein